MKLYYKMTLKAFVEAFEEVQGMESTFRLKVVELMHQVPEAEIDYILQEVPEVVSYLRNISPVWDELEKGQRPHLI